MYNPGMPDPLMEKPPSHIMPYSEVKLVLDQSVRTDLHLVLPNSILMNDDAKILWRSRATSSDETELKEDLDISRVNWLPFLDLLLPVNLFLVLKIEAQGIAVIVEAKHPGLSSRESCESHHQQFVSSPNQ